MSGKRTLREQTRNQKPPDYALYFHSPPTQPPVHGARTNLSSGAPTNKTWKVFLTKVARAAFESVGRTFSSDKTRCVGRTFLSDKTTGAAPNVWVGHSCPTRLLELLRMCGSDTLVDTRTSPLLNC